MRLIVFSSGLLLVTIVLWDAFEVMLLPIPVKRSIRVVTLFFRYTWICWRAVARQLTLDERRERLLGVYGPLSFVALIFLWMGGLIVGFALIHLALSSGSFGQSLYFSGTTFFTVGYGDLVPRSGATKATAVLEAGCGLGFLALVIGYLPVLYQLFADREAHVILLDERAGSPPTATVLLERHAEDRSLHSLDQLLREWELWASELMQSHTSYPMLSYYRSQYSNQSWLGALTSIMDICALIIVGIERVGSFQARMSFSVARVAIVEVCRVLGVEPSTDSASRLSSQQFSRMKQKLERLGLKVTDIDAELRLALVREQYEPYAVALSEYLDVPVPDWLISDSLAAHTDNDVVE
jgi:hypothetical protein